MRMKSSLQAQETETTALPTETPSVTMDRSVMFESEEQSGTTAELVESTPPELVLYEADKIALQISEKLTPDAIAAIVEGVKQNVAKEKQDGVDFSQLKKYVDTTQADGTYTFDVVQACDPQTESEGFNVSVANLEYKTMFENADVLARFTFDNKLCYLQINGQLPSPDNNHELVNVNMVVHDPIGEHYEAFFENVFEMKRVVCLRNKKGDDFSSTQTVSFMTNLYELEPPVVDRIEMYKDSKLLAEGKRIHTVKDKLVSLFQIKRNESYSFKTVSMTEAKWVNDAVCPFLNILCDGKQSPVVPIASSVVELYNAYYSVV